MKTSLKLCLLAGALTLASNANAQGPDHHHQDAPPAPLEIMGDHTHAKGEWMLSYRSSFMHMDGNRRGNNNISPAQIATTITNPNAPPATVRVVPTQMDMTMHMAGVMYGATDKLTLMAMAMHMHKEMDHITFMGGSGSTRLGTFTTNTSGFGDTTFGGTYKLIERDNHTINLNMGLSLPTGSIRKSDTVLAPTGARPRLRLPYAMQLGSGTYDALPGITYAGYDGDWGWGAQGSAILRLQSENDEGYRLGNAYTLTAWGARRLSDGLSVNALLSGETKGKIKGSDPLITAPVTTANPDNYGGETLELGLGVIYEPNYAKGLELGINARTPLYQNLNGVQLERDFTLTAGLTFRF